MLSVEVAHSLNTVGVLGLPSIPTYTAVPISLHFLIMDIGKTARGLSKGLRSTISANAFFPLFSKFLETLSMYSGDIGSVLVYGQARRFINWMLHHRRLIQT
jgi:hypothetical protein